MKTYDILVMGGGHNGLVAAAYLAKAGKSVLVVERADKCGGGVMTRELTLPGFKHDVHSSSHVMLLGNPMMRRDELGLKSRFGLEYHVLERPQATVFADGSYLVTYRDPEKTAESISQFSNKDADAYLAFARRGQNMLPMFMQGLYAPPAPLGPFMAMMTSSPEGRDIFDMMNRSPLDLVNEMFEDDRVKQHVLRPPTELLQFPDDMGTGTALYMFPALMSEFGSPKAVGGSGALADALLKAIAHFGGEVKTNSEVAKVVTRNGRAVGLQMVDGDEYLARDAVIAQIHPARLGHFIDELDPVLARRASRGKFSAFNVLLLHYALKEPLRFHAGDELTKVQMVHYAAHENFRDFMKQLDPLRHGELGDELVLSGQDQSYVDSTRAPAGNGVAFTQALVPFELADGGLSGWEAIKHDVAERVVRDAGRFVSNLTEDNILAREVNTPADWLDHSPNSFVNGDIHGLGGYFFQNGGMRPIAELADYRVPDIERLYLTGPFMHPGGSVFGAGRNTVMNTFRDLNIDFDQIAGAAV
jgi:phytoene dehydrogenase-like protein